MIIFGMSDIGTSGGESPSGDFQHFLVPGFSLGLAPVTPEIALSVTRKITISRIDVVHNNPSLDNPSLAFIQYRLRKNGVETSLFVNLAVDQSQASSEDEQITFEPDDKLSVSVIYSTTGIASGLLFPVVTLEDV